MMIAVGLLVAYAMVGLAWADDAPANGLQLRQGMNGEPVVAMDILAAMRNDRVQNANVFAKVPLALWEGTKATGHYAVDSPGNFAKTLGVSYLVVRGAQGKIGNDFDSLQRSVGLKSSKSKRNSNDPDRTSNLKDGSSVFVNEIKIEGDGNTVNQNIVVQQPQGSGQGQSPTNVAAGE